MPLLAFCLAAGAILSIIDRTDVNWDLQNYHLYGPFAVLHGRLGIDYFVAGIQGYLNPLADIPYYVTKFILFPNHPVIVAGLAGLPFGLLAFIVFNIARVMLPGAAAEAALAGILGLTGATILSEVGTVNDDILIADILLLGLWAVLRKPGSPTFSALCGLAVGSAAGLKLTALLYAPGLLVLCLIQARLWRPAALSALLFCIAVAIGFLALWGWWGALLWARFHNPFFPVFGSIFPSPWSPAIYIRDARFFPRDAAEWLFYPFFWLQGHSFIASEEPLRDPRLALVYLALAAGLLGIFTRYARPARPAAALWAFVAISYFFWLIGFSILRYAMPLEAISGIVIWTAMRLFLRKPKPWLLPAICIAVIAFTKPIGWGRIGYGKTLIEAPVPPLAANSLVFVSGAPIGFVVPYLNNRTSYFVSLDWLAQATAEFPKVRLLAGKAAAIRLLTNMPPGAGPVINARLAAFGLAYSENSCVPIRSPVQRNIRLCDVKARLP